MERCDIYQRHIVKADQTGVDGQETAQTEGTQSGRESCRRRTAYIGDWGGSSWSEQSEGSYLYKLIHLHAKLEDDAADEDGDNAVAVTPGGILSRKTSPRNPSLQRRLTGFHLEKWTRGAK